ncbi:hypothetical protein BLNAU_16824 [Blattamonas nauphoetae]|uniref:Protein kinase domain-containing protein n=1 Tax=Blattamonas nauphoetae TaxID=2049346 RepID=A0ABQ9XDB0_9EUKA|nr:hypothetical protein BLNAU_16824 [Blattamonas nauphoetae]
MGITQVRMSPSDTTSIDSLSDPVCGGREVRNMFGGKCMWKHLDSDEQDRNRDIADPCGKREFEMSEAAITKAVEFRGLGFLVNSSTFTTITTTGIESAGSGNVSLVSLALKPSSPSATLFTVKSSRSFLGQVRVESIEEHAAPLLVFSAGTSNVINCWFNLISLNEDAAVSITDSASVTFRATWADLTKCSSSGRAGCLDLTASATTSSVVFSDVIFSFNKAKKTLMHFGNDVAYSNFIPSTISTLESSRSLSDLPHCLANASITTNIACPLRYFSGYGIDHPLAVRFEQGVPLSWFKGFQVEIDALMESQTAVRLRVSTSQILEPIRIVRKNIEFQSCSLQSVQNFPLIQCSGGTLIIESITFSIPSGLTITGHSMIECSSTAVHTFTCRSSSFSNCKAPNGGVAWIELAGTNSILVKHEKTSTFASSFKNCVAIGDSVDPSNPTGKGGVLFVTGTSSHATPIRFNDSPTNHARFEDNLAGSGNDLFITSSLFESVPTGSLKSFGGGSFSLDDHVAIEGRLPSESAEIGLLIPSPVVSVNGSVDELMTGKSGEDTESCKWTSTFCATLGFGIKHLTKKYSTGELFPQSIQFIYNMTYNETAIIVNDQDVSVVGTKAKTPTQAEVLRTIVEIVPSTTASSLFTIKGNAKLSVSGLDLRPIAKCGLFCVESSGDSLKLSDLGIVCSLEAEYSQPLIKSNGRPISIELCTFNTTTSGTARLAHPLVQLVPPSGGVVPSAAFTLSSVSFSDFQTRSDPLVVGNTDGTISVVGTTFTRCSCSSEIKGTLVRVKTSGLSTAITEDLWSGSFDASTEAGWFYGQDRSLVSTNELPHPNCGSSRVGCSSFDSGVASSSKFSISTITLSRRCEMSRLFEASSSFTIESPTSPSSITLKEESQFKISASSAVLLLSSLQMEIDSSCSSSPLFVASKGTLHLSSCEIGTDTKTLIPPSVTVLMEVLGEGTLQLTTSTIKNVEFTHASEGSAILLHTSATFSTNSVNVFSGIWSNGTGSHIFVNSADLSETAINETILPFNATLSPTADSLFSEIDKNRFFGKDGLDEWSLLYLWHPHTSGTVHINTAGQDHPNCGTTQLPCSSIVESQSKLKGEQKLMNLDTKSVLSSELVSTMTEWTLTQSSGGSLWIEGEGQLMILKSNPSKLTLSGISMEFGTLKEGRTSSVMLIEEGWMILSLCEIGDGLTELGISFGRVCGGSLTIGGTKMNLVSSTAPLFSTESGSLIVEESCTITHPASSRTKPLLSISGGSASLTSTTIPPITLSSSNSLISVSGSGSLSVCDVDFESMENSGSGAVLHFSSSGCLWLDRVNLNGSSCGSSGKGRSLFITRTDAFTSNNLHLNDVTVAQPTSSGKHEIFIEGTSLESAACSDWKSFVGFDVSSFTPSTIVENWFENKEDSSLSGPVAYLIFGHSTGAIHISNDFWDHPNCGTEHLPCSSLLAAHDKLTEQNQNIILHSDIELSGVINAKSTGSEISSSSSGSPTKLTLTGVAQFKVPASTSLTLTSLVVSLPAAITKPIFLVAAGSLSLTSVDIQNTAVTTRSAAHLFSVTSGSLVLTDTNMLFDHLFELESSSVIEQNGGHVEMTRCPLGNVSKVTGDGSVVHSALTSATDSLLIEGGSFSSCSSGGKGGVIFVSSAAAVPSSNLIVRSTFDSSCSCGSSEKGSWVFVEGHLLSSLIAETNWQTTITSLSTPTHDSLLWGTDLSEKLESDYGSVSLLAFLAEYNNNSISVGAGGQDVSGCGLTIRRCVGLDLAHSHLDGVGTHSLVIHSESSLSSPISIGTHDLTLSAIGDSARVSVGLDGGFVISESELKVSKLDFVSNSKPQSRSLFEVNGGSGMISECSFTSFTLTSSALISHSCGTLTLLKTNFTSISRKVGNGGVLESVLTTSMELVVDDIWMKSVSALDGSGDGIFVSLTSIPKLSPIPSFRLQNVKYSVSSETNVSPRFIWVEGNDLSSWLDYSDSRFDGSYGVGVDEDWLWSVDKSESFSSSLVFYLKKGSGAIGFSEEGIVHARCGYFSAWCKSITQTLVRAAEMETTQINVKEFGRITSLVDVSNGTLFKGSPLMSIVRMSGGGSFSEAGGDTVHFESLHFEIENEDRREPAFSVTSGHLNVSNVELKVIGSSELSLFKSTSSQLSLQLIRFSETTSKLPRIVECEGGMATLSDIKMTSLSFSTTPFVLKKLREATFDKVTSKNSGVSELISISDGTSLEMTGCMFDSSLPSWSSNEDDLCSWSSGFVTILSTPTRIEWSRFSGFGNGALSITDSSLTLDSNTFHSNDGNQTSFPSTRRNVRCVNGSVEIGSVSGGDGFETPSLWIWTEDCEVTKKSIPVRSPLFNLTFDEKKSSSILNKDKSISATLVGSLLIPCSLFLEVFEKSEANQNKSPFVVALTPSNTISFTESEITLKLSRAELNKTLNMDSELRGCLIYGNGVRTGDFKFQNSLRDEHKSYTATVMKWLVPVICGVVGLLVLLLLVIVVIWCCRRNSKAKEAEYLVANQEVAEIEIVKEDFFAENTLGTTAFVFEDGNNVKHGGENHSTEVKEGQLPEDADEFSGNGKMVVVNGGGEETRTVSKYVSLYEHLHGKCKQPGMEKGAMMVELVKRMKSLLMAEPTSPLFTRLSPHVVLLNGQGEIRLDLKHGQSVVGKEVGTVTGENELKQQQEEQRWQAPETDRKDKSEIDVVAASVFSLGLLLAEIDTGQVPFGEIDALNAHRALGTGVLPKMDGVCDELQELVGQCLRINTSDRPDFDSILLSLSLIGCENAQKRNEASIPKHLLVVN